MATATAGTLIHTAVSGTSSMDEVYLYASNIHTADVVLTIEWGGAGVTTKYIVKTIPKNVGRILVIDGQPIGNANVIRAFAATTNVVTITGFVNQIV